MKKLKKKLKKINPKRSLRAQRVALKVLENLGKGAKSIKQIAIEEGFPENTANSGMIQRTQSYREIIDPIVMKMMQAREQAIALLPKSIKKAKYRDHIDGIDKLTKNIRLLSGKSTSNVSLNLKQVSDAELERIAAGGETGISEA